MRNMVGRSHAAHERRPDPRKCPLYPQKRTFSEAAQMSAKCHKRTLAAPGGRIVIRQFRENKLHSFYSHSN